MSSAFCSLDEAFAGPVMPVKKKKRSKDGVPGPLSGSPDPDNTVPEPMGPPTSSTGKPEAGMGPQEFFPIPGETAEPEEWAKAFMLEPSQVPMARADGSVSVAGKSTLWRKIPVAASAVPASIDETLARVPANIQQRLDALARQLDSLTVATPMQSTAELFLFIAIGLLFLLALDTLLRCATTIAVKKMSGGGIKGLRRWRS